MALAYRLLEHADELAAVEALEREVWGVDDLEVLPRSHLVASIHAGGAVWGAYDGPALIGFAYGFPAHHPEWDEPWGHHSHMVAVRSSHRGRGVGRRLKFLQREWCLERGLHWMTWTFDPLQAKNARLNLEHLGAVACRYLVNAYGRLGGSLNAELPTDRLLAYWRLDGARARRLAAGEPLPEVADLAALPLALRRGASGRPERLELPLEAGARVRLALPEDLTGLLERDPAAAFDWRLALREALQRGLAAGLGVSRFVGGGYLLEPLEERDL